MGRCSLFQAVHAAGLDETAVFWLTYPDDRWRDVLPAQTEVNVWTVADHVFYVLGEPLGSCIGRTAV